MCEACMPKCMLLADSKHIGRLELAICLMPWMSLFFGASYRCLAQAIISTYYQFVWQMEAARVYSSSPLHP